jgi:hypothetical protein
MFNVEHSRLILINEHTGQLTCYSNDKYIEENKGIGICGDLINRELRRIVIVVNPYEDPRYNSKIDIGISSSMFCIPLLKKCK